MVFSTRGRKIFGQFFQDREGVAETQGAMLSATYVAVKISDSG
jgi:hypothetical protein